MVRQDTIKDMGLVGHEDFIGREGVFGDFVEWAMVIGFLGITLIADLVSL